MIDLKVLLEEWHETKSIAIADDICEMLWNEMEAFEDDESELA